MKNLPSPLDFIANTAATVVIMKNSKNSMEVHG